MELKISDLLPGAGIEALPNPMGTDERRVREAVMAKLKEEKMRDTKRSPRRIGRTLLIAAAVASALTVAGFAAAHGFRELSHEKEDAAPFAGRDVVSVLPADSAQYKAYRELNDFAEEVRAGLPTGGLTPEEFAEVRAGEARIDAKYLELAHEYGLEPAREIYETRSLAELRSALGYELLPDDDGRAAVHYGRCDDAGNIEYRGGFTLAGGGVADYVFNYAAKGAMSTAEAYVYLDEVDEWEYSAANGREMLLGIGPDKSLVYMETEGGWALVTIRAGAEGADGEAVLSESGENRGSHTALTRGDIEVFAEALAAGLSPEH